MQIVVNEGIKGCLVQNQVDLRWGVSQGIIEAIPPDECVDDDPASVDSLDNFVDTFKSGTVICVQVGKICWV